MSNRMNAYAAVLAAVLVGACGWAWAADAPPAAAPPAAPAFPIAPGPYQPTWDSLKQYQCPAWFRDAKFGIWACWSAQCVPEQGDWYARGMYQEGSAHYKYHVEHYGHPSKFGYKDLIHLWTGEKWDPDGDMKLYKEAGAKYFAFMVNHHCNFDAWDSKYQPWNSVNMGPHKDLTAIYAAAARKYGLRFGVTVHCARTWDWFDVSHGSDKTGPLKGVPYDGCLTQADGKGQWWEGYDPADLYGPAGAARTPAARQAYIAKWYNRTKQLLDDYKPDLLYFDDGDLPLGDAGKCIAAHFYNANLRAHGGQLDAVLNIKAPPPGCRKAVVLDLERGLADKLQEFVWQTDTCIGDWHYRQGIQYKSATLVIAMLADIVSKNGNLLLNIPVRGDGSLDDREIAFLHDLADWMKVNSECIFATRPWKVFGEGKPQKKGGHFNEGALRYTASDIRFTTKGPALYAIALGWPQDRRLLVRSLARPAGQVTDVCLLGCPDKLAWTQTADALVVTLPEKKPCEHAFALKIAGEDLQPAPIAVEESVIQPQADGRIVLAAADAAIHGQTPQYEQSGPKDQIGCWANPADFVSWEFQAARAGTYSVEVVYSCASGCEGSGFAVEACGQTLAGTSAATGSWQTYATLKLGTIKIQQAGKVTLAVKPKTPPAWKVIGLKSVTLTPGN